MSASPSPGVVLLTGASSGIGLATARRPWSSRPHRR
jgi:NADP-dependent 3-hydroxy acid dehydrogenase YdfG